jgi:transposase
VARDLSRETDVHVLQQAVKLLEHENARLVAEIGKLMTEIAALKGQDPSGAQLRLQFLEHQLAVLQKKLFGESSERTPRSDSEEDGTKPVHKHNKRRKQNRIASITIRHELPEAERKCALCGEELLEWEGQHETSREVHVLRRAFVDCEHLQVKYRCRNGCSPKVAPPPRKLFRGARYSIGFALEVAIQKYLYHMPLARQVRQMRAEGLDVDTQTLWDQINKLATLLGPLYERILDFVLSHAVVGADETKWRMMGDKGPEGNKTWMVWTVATERAVYYQIQDSRSTAAAKKILGGFSGTVVCDGYDVYPALARDERAMLLAFCWAHVRRKYKDIEKSFPPETEAVVKLINELFEIECAAPPGDSDAALAERARLRNERSRDVVEKIKTWAIEVRTTPGTTLADAIGYMTRHWSGLIRFLEDPRIPLSNNTTERANRNPVVGRKNHYGSRSKRGTEVAAILYSILETTRNAGVDAHAYLELAVERAQDGLPVALPHELEAEVAARAAQHLALAAASAKGENHAWPVGGA